MYIFPNIQQVTDSRCFKPAPLVSLAGPLTLGASSTVPNLSSREVLRWSTSRQFSLFSMAPWVKYGEMGSEIWDSLHFMGSFMAVLNGKPLDFGGPSVLTNPNVPFDDPTMTQRSPQRIPSRNLAEEKPILGRSISNQRYTRYVIDIYIYRDR